MLKVYKPEDIAFFGDSAGCALSLAVCFRARDNKLPLPSRLFLFSPAHIDVSEENCREEMAILAPDDILIPLQLIDNLNEKRRIVCQCNICVPFRCCVNSFNSFCE